MARADTVAKVRSILYGSGLYEKPAIRLLDGSGNDSLGSGATVTLTTGEASSVAKGDVLSGTTGAAASAYAFYVTGTTSTTVTAIPQYLGSPDPSAADLNGAVLEQNPKATEHEIHNAIDTILNSYLYPELFATAADTVTPDLSTYQVEVPAAVKEIVGVWQVQSGRVVPIKYSLHKELPTGLSSTATLLEAGFIDGSTAHYKFWRKIVESDTYDWLEDLLAYGAAALLIDTASGNTLVPYRPDTGDVQAQLGVGEQMWRSFLTIREQARLDLSRDYPEFGVRH